MRAPVESVDAQSFISFALQGVVGRDRVGVDGFQHCQEFGITVDGTIAYNLVIVVQNIVIYDFKRKYVITIQLFI